VLGAAYRSELPFTAVFAGDSPLIKDSGWTALTSHFPEVTDLPPQTEVVFGFVYGDDFYLVQRYRSRVVIFDRSEKK
jgi:hypothetical protein